jgi:hypothetical protein
MPITRINQLKKWRVPELKKILKDNGVKGLSKKNKMKLITMISELKNFKELKETLSIPVRVKKAASAKQLAARKRFSEMAKNKSKKVVKEVKKVVEKEVKKVEKKVEKVEKKVVPVKNIVEKQLKEISNLGLENTSSREEPKPSSKAPVDIVIPKTPRRQLFDSVFGERQFSFSDELNKVMDELEHQGKLDKFLDLSKKDKKKMLKKRFNEVSSITKLVNLF